MPFFTRLFMYLPEWLNADGRNCWRLYSLNNFYTISVYKLGFLKIANSEWPHQNDIVVPTSLFCIIVSCHSSKH
jgi:hypothetical protein